MNHKNLYSINKTMQSIADFNLFSVQGYHDDVRSVLDAHIQTYGDFLKCYDVMADVYVIATQRERERNKNSEIINLWQCLSAENRHALLKYAEFLADNEDL